MYKLQGFFYIYIYIIYLYLQFYYVSLADAP